MSVAKLRHKVEVNLHARGKDIHCEAVELDMYAAIDALVDKLDRQVVKHKEKLARTSSRGRGDQARGRGDRSDAGADSRRAGRSVELGQSTVTVWCGRVLDDRAYNRAEHSRRRAGRSAGLLLRPRNAGFVTAGFAEVIHQRTGNLLR